MGKIKNDTFAKAAVEQERLKREKAVADSNGGSFTDYEKPTYLGLEDQVEKVFRLCGAPFITRTEPTDCKLILRSEIVVDDLTWYLPVNWPMIEDGGTYKPDPSWILKRLYEKVTEGKWQKRADGKKNDWGNDSEKIHDHKDLAIFDRVTINRRREEKAKFSKKFYPARTVLINIIDRMDTWCAENKHTKLLSKYVGTSHKTVDGEEKTYLWPHTGIPYNLYLKVFEHYNRHHGNWSDVDCVTTKVAERNEYDVFDASDTKYVSAEAIAKASIDDFTDEELEYEMYNLDVMFGVTRYGTLKKHLTGLFKLCDANLGTDFHSELLELVEYEIAEYRAMKKAEEDATPKEVVKSEDEVPVVDEPVTVTKEPEFDPETETEPEKAEEVKEETIPETPKRRRPVEEAQPEPEIDVLSIEDLCEQRLPQWYKLTISEKRSLIADIDRFDGNVIVYKSTVEDLGCFNETCTFIDSEKLTTFPETISTCPVCGAKEVKA